MAASKKRKPKEVKKPIGRELKLVIELCRKFKWAILPKPKPNLVLNLKTGISTECVEYRIVVPPTSELAEVMPIIRRSRRA